MLKKMLIEIRLCNPVTYIFKGDVKIFKICMVKFNVSISNKLKIIKKKKKMQRIYMNIMSFLKICDQTCHYFDKMFFFRI